MVPFAQTAILWYNFRSVPDRPIPNPAAVQEEGPDGWTLLVNPDTAGSTK
jgi:hypothetical protein